jgi:hypothetical protein
MFKIVQHFKTALEECHDVKSKLPNLHKANVKKLTKKSQKKIMIFIIRLHFAMYVLNILEGKKWKLDFATFPELKKLLSELEYDLTMVEKLDEHNPIPNLPIMTNDGIPTCITAIKTELADMKQSIDRVQTILDNFSTELQFTVAVTRATMLEGLVKKEPKEGNDSDSIM